MPSSNGGTEIIMNGLDSILQKIEQDAEASAAKILQEANLRSEKYKDEKRILAEKEAKEIADAAEKRAAAIGESSVSGSEAYVKRGRLAAKSDVINDFISYAAKQIDLMPDGEYFDSVKKLILKYASDGNGELIFSDKDIKRMPKGFVASVNGELKGKTVSLAENLTEKITGGGFIIRYGEIEQNCTFKALIEEKSDEIKDALFRLTEGRL